MANTLPYVDRSFLEDPTVGHVIESLNSAGWNGINAASGLHYDEYPFRIINPVNRKKDPLGEFPSINLRFMGFGNGLRCRPQTALSALVTEITGCPTIEVPFPDRDWRGNFSITSIKGFGFSNPEERVDKAQAQLDEVTRRVLGSLFRLVQKRKTEIKGLNISGESVGATVGLHLGTRASEHFDVQKIAIAATPTYINRRPYIDLLLQDFAHSVNQPGGLKRSAESGAVAYIPFLEAHDFLRSGDQSRMEITMDALTYMFRDMMAGPSINGFMHNRALAYMLSTPVSVKSLEHSRGTNVQIHQAFFENDPVASPQNFDPAVGSPNYPNRHNYVFGNYDHGACNNPYVIGYMAKKLVSA